MCIVCCVRLYFDMCIVCCVVLWRAWLVLIPDLEVTEKGMVRYRCTAVALVSTCILIVHITTLLYIRA